MQRPTGHLFLTPHEVIVVTQLILDINGSPVSLPESKKGGYIAEKRPLSVDVEMVTGRMVRELRGSVWVVTYQYGYFTDIEKNNVIAACQKGQRGSIRCAFLQPTSSGALSYSDFLVTSFSYPKFMWSKKTSATEGTEFIPMWGDFSLEMREVQPSD